MASMLHRCQYSIRPSQFRSGTYIDGGANAGVLGYGTGVLVRVSPAIPLFVHQYIVILSDYVSLNIPHTAASCNVVLLQPQDRSNFVQSDASKIDGPSQGVLSRRTTS